MKNILIGDRAVGSGEPCFIIAEAGSNHDRNLNQAKRLVDAALAARADAVKFQTFTAETIAARTDAEVAKIDFAGAKSLFDLYKSVELPREWQREIKEYCDKKGIMFLSSPFDYGAIDELDELGMPVIKIASFELVDLPLLRHAARTGKPLILSTGMANLGEIEDALGAIYAEGNRQVILLHCAINYPAPFASVNLAAMDTIRQAFDVPVGYSDHTLGNAVPVAAVARGASVIEKHFTLDKGLPGPDHSFAMNPEEFASMVHAIRDTEAAMGSAIKGPAADEAEHLLRGRRSLFAKVAIPKDTTITNEMLAVLRPGIGLMSKYLDVVVGRQARRDIKAHEPITWDII
jgi:pseudaminic acid synthase